MLRVLSLQKQLTSGTSSTLAKNVWRGCSGPASARRRRHLHTSPPAVTPVDANKSEWSRPPFKILFAGGDRFSIASLNALAEESKDLVQELHVLVSPDKRTSRGLKEVRRPPLRTRAEELGLPISVLPEGGIKSFTPPVPFDTYSPSHLLITASFGHLIPSRLLDLFPPLSALNVHPSLLPKYRGAAPIQWCIVNGELETGVTIQSLSRGTFDEGQILAQSWQSLNGEEDYAQLEEKLAHNGAQLLIDTLQQLDSQQAGARIQDIGQVVKAPKLRSEDAKVDFASMSADAIARRFRGMAHQLPLWTMLSNKRVQLLSAIAYPRSSGLAKRVPPQPGTAVLSPLSDSILISCKDGSVLQVHTLKTEARKALDAKSWWIGMARKQGSLVFGQ